MDIIDGKKISNEILTLLKEKIKKSGVEPTLTIILVGKDPASVSYVNQKKRAGEKIGAKVLVENFDEEVSQEELKSLIFKLNGDDSVHGMILQLPLPKHLDTEALSSMISPEKDVDGFVSGSKFKSATALGIINLLENSNVPIKGKKVTVVGRGKIAGQPTAALMTNLGAKVTVCDTSTVDLIGKTRAAGILVVAIGRPKFIKANMVKKGAVVVDVGTNPLPMINDQAPITKLVGDVDFENVKKIASKITPVPGGVGPMTVATLMQNLVKAAEAQE